MASQYYEGIGRRKAASARVRIYPGGTGNYVVNERDASEYLTRPGDIEISLEPLRVVGQEGNYDISVHVY
ncbi:MAG: 30S ribosomal protein S9, partial [Anaerolineae bacterium UTCFX5]